MDNIYQNLDVSLTVVGIYLDLTKAFNTVNHDLLLYKYKIMQGTNHSMLEKQGYKW